MWHELQFIPVWRAKLGIAWLSRGTRSTRPAIPITRAQILFQLARIIVSPYPFVLKRGRRQVAGAGLLLQIALEERHYRVDIRQRLGPERRHVGIRVVVKALLSGAAL